MPIDYSRTTAMTAAAYIEVLRRSGLAERRPVGDTARIERMLRHANLLIVARDPAEDRLVGVARSLTDFAHTCYLADLAVDKAYQGQGIGKRLIAETRAAAGPETTCLLLSAPGAMSFYQSIGMPMADNAFLYPRER